MYDARMAAAYVHGRRMSPTTMAAWMDAARPYLPGPGGTVLDLGAGTGRFSAALAETCRATVVACEPSAAMRATCRSQVGKAVPVVGGRAEALPFAADAFDTVWLSQVIHHVDDPAAGIREVGRVLRPGGYLLLRGGFGDPADLPLYPYFPQAWASGYDWPAALRETATLLADVGIRLLSHRTVEQEMAADPADLIERVRTRSLSLLAQLPDSAFAAGLAALEADARDGRLTGPITEQLDFVIFRAA
jgi:SAM-dependent methyltransferase